MQSSTALVITKLLSSEATPHLTSFDSGYEGSLEYWMRVAVLVEGAQQENDDRKGYVFHDSLLSGFSFARQEVTLLEVESPPHLSTLPVM
jgi:hypothetical protein